MNWRAALNRTSYGVQLEDIASLQEKGWKTWVQEQLNNQPDTACERKVKAIQYILEDAPRGKKQGTLFRYLVLPQIEWVI